MSKLLVKKFSEAIQVMPTNKILEKVNRPRYYQKKNIVQASSEKIPTPFRENLFSYSHKNNLSYPEELVYLVYFSNLNLSAFSLSLKWI
jgi:hypothetical protein